MNSSHLFTANSNIQQNSTANPSAVDFDFDHDNTQKPPTVSHDAPAPTQKSGKPDKSSSENKENKEFNYLTEVTEVMTILSKNEHPLLRDNRQYESIKFVFYYKLQELKKTRTTPLTEQERIQMVKEGLESYAKMLTESLPVACYQPTKHSEYSSTAAILSSTSTGSLSANDSSQNLSTASDKNPAQAPKAESSSKLGSGILWEPGKLDLSRLNSQPPTPSRNLGPSLAQQLVDAQLKKLENAKGKQDARHIR